MATEKKKEAAATEGSLVSVDLVSLIVQRSCV